MYAAIWFPIFLFSFGGGGGGLKNTAQPFYYTAYPALQPHL